MQYMKWATFTRRSGCSTSKRAQIKHTVAVTETSQPHAELLTIMTDALCFDSSTLRTPKPTISQTHTCKNKHDGGTRQPHVFMRPVGHGADAELSVVTDYCIYLNSCRRENSFVESQF